MAGVPGQPKPRREFATMKPAMQMVFANHAEKRLRAARELPRTWFDGTVQGRACVERAENDTHGTVAAGSGASRGRTGGAAGAGGRWAGAG